MGDDKKNNRISKNKKYNSGGYRLYRTPANDFKQVTNLARKMVCLWGMSDKPGPVFYKQSEEHQFLGKEITRQKDFSEHTQQIIDDEIKEIILDMERKAEYIIKTNRVKLDALADALIENETLDKKQIDWILDKVEEGEEAAVE